MIRDSLSNLIESIVDYSRLRRSGTECLARLNSEQNRQQLDQWIPELNNTRFCPMEKRLGACPKSDQHPSLWTPLPGGQPVLAEQVP